MNLEKALRILHWPDKNVLSGQVFFIKDDDKSNVQLILEVTRKEKLLLIDCFFLMSEPSRKKNFLFKLRLEEKNSKLEIQKESKIKILHEKSIEGIFGKVENLIQKNNVKPIFIPHYNYSENFYTP
jgi:hypothetical protein